MRAERLLSALAEGRPAFGTVTHSADPAIVEIAGIVGHDWISITLEHAGLSGSEIASLVRTADVRGISTLVHVANATDLRILSLLDDGVGGVVAPHVETAAEAAALVQAARYPPLGGRGASGACRSSDYSARPYAEVAATANDSVAVGIVIETKQGVENADEILAVPGLNFVYIGLMDLSQSLGMTGDYKHQEVQAAAESVIARAHDHGVAVGLSAYGFTVPELLSMGARMITTPTSANSVLFKGFQAALAEARQAAADYESAGR